MSLVGLALALIVGGVAPARAADHDVITLATGERVVGELVDVRDGQYWVLLPDGRMVGIDFREVELVEMASSRLRPIDPADLPAPTWSEREPDALPFVGGGFDVGLYTGGRLRLRVQTPLIAHVDLRLGALSLLGPDLGAGVVTGMDVALIGKGVVHPVLSGVVGAGFMFGELGPLLAGGPGVQIDPEGPFEVHLGVQVGTTTLAGLSVAPDISVAWVW